MYKQILLKSLLFILFVSSIIWYWVTSPTLHTYMAIVALCLFIFVGIQNTIQVNKLKKEIESLKVQLKNSNEN